jgi:hypothetical protein
VLKEKAVSDKKQQWEEITIIKFDKEAAVTPAVRLSLRKGARISHPDQVKKNISATIGVWDKNKQAFFLNPHLRPDQMEGMLAVLIWTESVIEKLERHTAELTLFGGMKTIPGKPRVVSAPTAPVKPKGLTTSLGDMLRAKGQETLIIQEDADK